MRDRKLQEYMRTIEVCLRNVQEDHSMKKVSQQQLEELLLEEVE